ncbi:MAG TPA: FecR family protein, partial [Smithellaceae bacterium]|nr:FecR family protein [Smithellaceae bacterium]HQH06091.1 FecR family protein [Smithellaceae bacterium]
MRAKLTSFLSILCLLMVFAAAVQAAPAGKVTNLEGRADLTAPGQPAKALLIGDTVNVGDILRTKSGSKLEVTWIDGSIARLSENSRLKVTEFTLGAKKRSTILSLFRGKVQNVVTGATQLFGEKDGSRYEIHTPTSVCGVRGTVFFTYHENGVSGALFTEGKGFMYSKGQPGNVKPVAPGVMMIVTSANKPPEAKPAKPGDATKLFNATNPSEKKKDDKKGEEKKEGATGGGTSGTGGT